MDLNVDPIGDARTRENFQKIIEEFGKNPFLKGTFRVFESSPKKADTSHKIIHGLGFAPTDIIITFISNDATVRPVFSDVTRTVIAFDVSKECTFRCLAGSFT